MRDERTTLARSATVKRSIRTCARTSGRTRTTIGFVICMLSSQASGASSVLPSAGEVLLVVTGACISVSSSSDADEPPGGDYSSANSAVWPSFPSTKSRTSALLLPRHHPRGATKQHGCSLTFTGRPRMIHAILSWHIIRSKPVNILCSQILSSAHGLGPVPKDLFPLSTRVLTAPSTTLRQYNSINLLLPHNPLTMAPRRLTVYLIPRLTTHIGRHALQTRSTLPCHTSLRRRCRLMRPIILLRVHLIQLLLPSLPQSLCRWKTRAKRVLQPRSRNALRLLLQAH